MVIYGRQKFKRWTEYTILVCNIRRSRCRELLWALLLASQLIASLKGLRSTILVSFAFLFFVSQPELSVCRCLSPSTLFFLTLQNASELNGWLRSLIMRQSCWKGEISLAILYTDHPLILYTKHRISKVVIAYVHGNGRHSELWQNCLKVIES